jgi:hypothetical protein
MPTNYQYAMVLSRDIRRDSDESRATELLSVALDAAEKRGALAAQLDARADIETARDERDHWRMAVVNTDVSYALGARDERRRIVGVVEAMIDTARAKHFADRENVLDDVLAAIAREDVEER